MKNPHPKKLMIRRYLMFFIKKETKMAAEAR